MFFPDFIHLIVCCITYFSHSSGSSGLKSLLYTMRKMVPRTTPIITNDSTISHSTLICFASGVGIVTAKIANKTFSTDIKLYNTKWPMPGLENCLVNIFGTCNKNGKLAIMYTKNNPTARQLHSSRLHR